MRQEAIDRAVRQGLEYIYGLRWKSYLRPILIHGATNTERDCIGRAYRGAV